MELPFELREFSRGILARLLEEKKDTKVAVGSKKNSELTGSWHLVSWKAPVLFLHRIRITGEAFSDGATHYVHY